MLPSRLTRLVLSSTALSCCFAFRTLSSSVGRTCHQSLYATVSPTSWMPCVQPRFDEFASSTVGPWVTRASKTESHEVEEVMRSCGGAVQGIRELSLSVASQLENANDEKIYLNRADGGFVYVDDGSYSFGPEKWDFEADDTTIMTSLAFSGSQRGWLTAKLSSEDGMLPQSTALEMFRPISSIIEKLNADTLDSDNSIPLIDWNRIQRVRMPNSSQPWSLARAKWEKQQLSADEASNLDDSQSGLGALMGWSFVEAASKDNGIFADIIGNESSFNVHMLVICKETSIARSTTRCYDSTGLLKSVAFLDGHIRREVTIENEL